MSLADIVANVIAGFALAVSLYTAWLTLRSGRVHMTRPNIIGFVFDGSTPKIFLRFLLYSSAQRGNVIESMFVVLTQGGKRKIYSFWGYGDSPGSLVRGSGLFVSREGIATNHHFVLPLHEAVTPIDVGNCTISVYATVLGQVKDHPLYSIQLDISETDAVMINNPKAGLLYDWHPDSKRYYPEPR